MTATSHRFVVEPEAVSGASATLRGDQARQIATVLRLSPGVEIVLVAAGEDIGLRLDRVTPSEVTGTVVSRAPNAAEPRLRLTLALPILKGDRSEEILEAVTQLGVSRVVPFVSERSVARELSEAKRRRWERIARESAETARRGLVPEMLPASTWAALFEVLPPPIVVAWEGERERRLSDVPVPADRTMSLVIGPEGGLTEQEIALARERGAEIVSLGPRNLRSETAAIAAVAQLLAALG